MKRQISIFLTLAVIMSVILSGCAPKAPEPVAEAPATTAPTTAPSPEPTDTVPPTSPPTEEPTKEPATEEPATAEATDAQTTSDFPAPPDFPVTIGLALPFSGELKFLADSASSAVMYAVEQARAAGWEIEIIKGDTKCDAQEAVNAANKLIYEDDVHYLIGAICSSASIPISELADGAGVIQITSASTNPQVTIYEDGTNKEYIFRSCFMDPFQGEVMATVARDLGARKAAVLYDLGNDYVKGLAEYFRSSFEAAGGEVVVYEAYTKDDTDFSGILGKVVAEDPDVIFLPDYFSKTNLIAAQIQERGIDATLLGGDGWDSTELATQFYEGGYYSTHYSPADPRPVVQNFVAAYEADTGGKPDAIATLAYDAARILLQGISEAGVDDTAVVSERIAQMEVEGVSGEISFDENGDPIKKAAIIKIENGEHSFDKFVAP